MFVCCHDTWQLDIGCSWKMPGITSTLPSNGTSGGGLQSGPGKRNSVKKSPLTNFQSLFKAFPHLWHISATHPPLGLKSSLLCFRFLIRPGRASEKLFSILQIASIMRLHLTCHFKGGLMVVLLKRHPFLTNKTDTLSKWDGVAKPDQFLWQLRVTILHFLQTCNQLSLTSFYLAYDMFFVQTHHPVCLRWV